jgi:hypothetical protein
LFVSNNALVILVGLSEKGTLAKGAYVALYAKLWVVTLLVKLNVVACLNTHFTGFYLGLKAF